MRATGSNSLRLASVWCLCLCLTGCGKPRPTANPYAVIGTGWENYRLGEFGLALKDFQSAMDAAPRGSDLHLAALYGAATTWNLRRPGEDPKQAADIYRAVIAAAPTNDLAAWSWLALARMRALPVAGESPDLQEQVTAYQDAIDRFPFHPAGEEAFLSQQAARLEKPDAARTREVLDALDRFIRTHPQSPWRSTAYNLAAHCCAVLNLKDRRLDAVIQGWKTAESDPLNPVQDLSLTYWQIATVAEFDAGDFSLAREYYRRLIAEYPTEQRVFLAKQELRRMDDLETRIRQAAEGGEKGK